MSTEFGKVKGRHEVKHHADYTVDYGESKMYVNRFYGGENGPMIQLTITGNDKGAIQLTEKEAKRLAKKIKRAFKF
jgi:hypothetical protein